ncbi:MAG: site-2 protease family protein [Defluviitaleaceae bacterium]|nr:site-2 protease family protein [Defluviitaleaceae bacterium]
MLTAVSIIAFILILSVVIFIHELGHFLAARRAGVFVEEFALGMGPKLIQFKGKKKSTYTRVDENGEPIEPEVTLYTLRMLPIGGYCKMRGQDEDVPDDHEAMNNKSVKARLLIIAGGSLMNFLLAFLLFFGLAVFQGFPTLEVREVQVGAPGYHAGLQSGDIITHVNGVRTGTFTNLVFLLDMSGGQEQIVRINRGGERIELPITPIRNQHDNYVIGFITGHRYGLLAEPPAEPIAHIQRVNIATGIVAAGENILFHIRTPFTLITRFITRQNMPEGGGIMGPIGIGGEIVAAGQMAAELNFGFVDIALMVVSMMALLNAALGVMNLLPIPALDGARLIFLVIEGIRRRPVPPDKEAVVHLVGLVAILVLAVFIAYRDIMRLI